MALGQLIVRIGADFTDLNKATDKVDRDIQRLGRKLTSIGTGLSMKVTAPIVAMGAAVLKAGIDFESSFAGIRKTMDLTEAEFSRLAQANRDLAREIPVAVEEINRIGELAGQLGIEGVDNVLKFERTIAQLAVTTDLTADDAALSFAQIANVMRIPQQDIDRLGATVVGLGNNFATVESKIVAFTQRIAGAGQLSGVAAGELVGIATAFSSIGVESEAGGTAVQKVLLGMVAAVAEGGAELNTFARTAGMSSAEFQRAFRDDAAGAFVSFVEGLGTQGDSAIGTLDSLGLGNERVRAAFLSAAGAGDLLRTAVAQGSEEWAANTDLVAEAEKRFATAESQLRIFWNKLKDVGITLGTALIPILLDTINTLDPLIGIVAAIATGFASLPEPIVGVVTAVVGLAAALGPLLLVIGQFLKVWPLLQVAFLAATGPAGWIALAAVGIGALTLAVIAWTDASKEAARQADEWNGHLQKMLDLSNGLTEAELYREITLSSAALSREMQKLDDLQNRLEVFDSGAWREMGFSLNEAQEQAARLNAQIDSQKELIGSLGARMEGALDNYNDIRTANRQLATSFTTMGSDVDRALDMIADSAEEMATDVTTAVARMGEDILADIGEVAREVPASFRTMDGELREIVPEMVSEVETENGRMRDRMIEIADEAQGRVSGIFDQYKHLLPPKIQDAVDKISEKWGFLRGILEDPFLGDDGTLAKLLREWTEWGGEIIKIINFVIERVKALNQESQQLSGPGAPGGGAGGFGGGGLPADGTGGGFGFPEQQRGGVSGFVESLGTAVGNMLEGIFGGGKTAQGLQAVADSIAIWTAWQTEILVARWDALLTLWERDHHWWSQAATETLNVRDHLAAIRAEIMKLAGGFGLIENYLGTIAFEFAPIVEAIQGLGRLNAAGFDSLVAAVQGIEFPASPAFQPQVSGFAPAFAAPSGGGFVVNQVFNFPAGVAATRQQIQASAYEGVDQALGQRAQRSDRLAGNMGVSR